ncbi:MAG: GHKL domain-containing protein, partial [Streptococcus salivarius]
YQVRQRLLVGVTLAYIVLSLIIFYASNIFPYTGLFIYLAGSITVVYSILFILLFAQLNIYSKRRVKDQLAEEMARHEESLEEYSHRLEKLYNDISQVKKDYLEGLKTMEVSIQRRDLPTLKQEYAELLEKSGNSLTLSNYELSRLINLEITSLKSLFSAKVLEAENLGIKVNLELPDVISSTQIEALDLVVISSVFLNNAIESAVDSEDPTLTISFFKNQGYLILVIDNTTREERIPVSRIFDEGVSSKGEGRGLGLSKVADILNRYPKVNLETRSCDHHFTQVLSFQDN